MQSVAAGPETSLIVTGRGGAVGVGPGGAARVDFEELDGLRLAAAAVGRDHFATATDDGRAATWGSDELGACGHGGAKQFSVLLVTLKNQILHRN